jgi:hypothetical protein
MTDHWLAIGFWLLIRLRIYPLWIRIRENVRANVWGSVWDLFEEQDCDGYQALEQHMGHRVRMGMDKNWNPFWCASTIRRSFRSGAWKQGERLVFPVIMTVFYRDTSGHLWWQSFCAVLVRTQQGQTRYGLMTRALGVMWTDSAGGFRQLAQLAARGGNLLAWSLMDPELRPIRVE